MNTALKIVKEDFNSEGKRTFINHDSLIEKKKDVLFIDFINKTIQNKSKRSNGNHSKNYKTVIFLIEEFCKLNDAVIYTNSVNEEFLDEFILFLENRGAKLNYIVSLISLIKTLVRKASVYGYIVDPSYDNIKVKFDDIYYVYLSMNELTRIYYYEGLSKKQIPIRDLFVLGCLTALRYSDYSTLNKENIVDDFIVKITKKTGKKVIIPIHDYVREILNKYDNDLPKITIQYFNREIKKICKKVGINDKISFTYIKGGKPVYEVKEKWELVSSHTARRSASTNMYMTGRMKTNEIMNLTGHTTEKSFFRYVRTTGEELANKISGDNYFKK
jgi:integrase